MIIAVYLCATGESCVSRLIDLQQDSLSDLRPIILLLDVPHDERLPNTSLRLGSSSSDLVLPDSEASKGQYGLRLLQKVVSEAHFRNLSKLVVPIPIVSFLTDPSAYASDVSTSSVDRSQVLPKRGVPDRLLVKACLDFGAVDIMVSPLHRPCLSALEVIAYRAHKNAAREQHELLEVKRGRKRSWVGVSDEKPFAYLREAMVSGLMKGICRLSEESDDRADTIRVSIGAERKARVAAAISQWSFCAHDFSDDELVVASLLMFKHALTIPELEKYRIPTGMLPACTDCIGVFLLFPPSFLFPALAMHKRLFRVLD